VKVYLIRHAQSVENALGMTYRLSQAEFNAFLRDTTEAPLSSLGLQQTRRVVRLLRDKSIQRLYTSPFVRARCTAAILGRACDLTPQVMPDLGEIMPAELPESRREASLRWHFMHGYSLLARPGSSPENWLAVYRRALRVWQATTQETAHPVAVVSHYAFLHILLLAAHVHWRCSWHGYHLQNGGVTCVEIH